MQNAKLTINHSFIHLSRDIILVEYERFDYPVRDKILVEKRYPLFCVPSGTQYERELLRT